MRKFKYRVWDRDESCMYFNLKSPKDLNNCIKALSNYTIMQYTGITNVFNQDIYEGDVVRVKVDGNLELRLVLMTKGCFFAAKKNHKPILVDSYMEVVGNMFTMNC